MATKGVGGYAGNIGYVDLTAGDTRVEETDEVWRRRWLGGSGFGADILFREVPPSANWDDPVNRLVVASGPLAGTTVMGSGTISVVTKGAMTNGATTTQANGFMGAYMKFAGFDALVLSGRSPRWVYIYLHDGVVELRDAAPIMGLDTWEMQDALAKQLGVGERALSVFGVGPAGEKLVRFAAIAGDHGHVAGHNGSGAVLGSKRVKAIVAQRGKAHFTAHDPAALKATANEIIDVITRDPANVSYYLWGTGMNYTAFEKSGVLPVRNYTTNIFPGGEPFLGENYRPKYATRMTPCWACRMHHLHELEIKEGPYKGFKGEEPEYEQWAAWGSLIGNRDAAGAIVLSNDVDRLGLENNEAGWVVAWAMECYEKGILTREDTGGIELTWGDVDAARALLRKIANREGIGDLLAEGVQRASVKLGRGSEELAVYSMKGNSPRGHDHRSRWIEMLDTCVSDTGTITIGPPVLQQEQGAPPSFGAQNPDQIGEVAGKSNGRMVFEDCLGTCRFTNRTTMEHPAKAVADATGWDYTAAEGMATARRILALLRVYNLRCGIGPELEQPSKRYGSTPVDGPLAGKSIAPHWEGMRARYYELMGWDMASGRPLPETLRSLGLGDLVGEVWGGGKS